MRITELVEVKGDWLTIAAIADDRLVAIRVPIVRWEQLQANAPVMSDADDRRDYAMGMIEWEASQLPSVDTPEGPAITLPWNQQRLSEQK